MENTTALALSVKSAAVRLGVSTRFIGKLIASGELPSVKIGRRRLIREESLVAFLNSAEFATCEQILRTLDNDPRISSNLITEDDRNEVIREKVFEAFVEHREAPAS